MAATHETNYPPYADRLLKGSRLKKTLWLGIIVSVYGLTAPSSLIIGLLLLAMPVYVLSVRRRVIRQDLASASALATALRGGVAPTPVNPAAIDTHGELLMPDESCYVNAESGEMSLFYGKPAQLTQGMVIAWGSPLAFIGSSIFTLGLLDRRRKKAGQAAPQWREMTPVDVWITSRRLLIKTRQTGQSLHIPLNEISSCSVDGDSLVIVGSRTNSEFPVELPIRVRMQYAAWCSVLLYFLINGQVVNVQVPASSQSTETQLTATFPGSR